MANPLLRGRAYYRLALPEPFWDHPAHVFVIPAIEFGLWPAYLAFAVATAGNVMLAQNARDAKELRPPVFTREQAVRGRALYGSHCARCHGADLRGREHAPSLLTLRQWSVGFESLGRFFGYVYANMPPDTPGQHLSLQTHVDIVAYILERNRYPAGDIELPADVEAIDEMSFSRQGQ